jgi:hypothetical protein
MMFSTQSFLFVETSSATLTSKQPKKQKAKKKTAAQKKKTIIKKQMEIQISVVLIGAFECHSKYFKIIICLEKAL